VLEATMLDTPVDVPDETRRRALDAGLFTPAKDDPLVTISLDPPARWVADFYPCEEVEERGDGGLIVRLRVRDDAWVRRLALGLAGLGRVTEPAELAAEVRNAAIATLAAYNL
jgi:proteasome accessory factor C